MPTGQAAVVAIGQARKVKSDGKDEKTGDHHHGGEQGNDQGGEQQAHFRRAELQAAGPTSFGGSRPAKNEGTIEGAKHDQLQQPHHGDPAQRRQLAEMQADHRPGGKGQPQQDQAQPCAAPCRRHAGHRGGQGLPQGKRPPRTHTANPICAPPLRPYPAALQRQGRFRDKSIRFKSIFR